MRTEADLLAELNRHLPAGVDWKQGAVTYLSEMIRDGGATAERYELVKPFMGGPDYEAFWTDVFQFLDMIELARISRGDQVIDVGCGPGWTVQWLAKLGHEVIGFDISPDLIEIAERRMQGDPFPPYVGAPFRYQLRVHDIEERPLGLQPKARFAVFASVLHHFVNPVAALRHVADDVDEDGLFIVIEGAAPPQGSEWDKRNLELMEQYHTVERPYTRQQLLDIFELAGLSYVSLVHPINGAFSQEVDVINTVVDELSVADNVNTLFAARTAAGIERIGLVAERVADLRTGWTVITGSAAPESLPDGRRFRWCGPRVLLRLDGAGPHRLEVRAQELEPGQVQALRVLDDGKVRRTERLTSERPEAVLTVSGQPGQLLELQSDRVVSPAWTGGHDTRVLSFKLILPASDRSRATFVPRPRPVHRWRRLARALRRRARRLRGH